MDYTWVYAKEVAMSHVAKLFTNGRSQAVRLPAAYRFDTKQAAHAASKDAVLVTSDNSFSLVPRLKTEDWTA